MREAAMGPAIIKYRIKKTLLVILSKRKSGSRLIMMMRSARQEVTNSAPGLKKANQTTTKEIDSHALATTLRQAQIAYNKGEHRLALLLAHLCDCISNETPDPELSALLAELKANDPTIS